MDCTKNAEAPLMPRLLFAHRSSISVRHFTQGRRAKGSLTLFWLTRLRTGVGTGALQSNREVRAAAVMLTVIGLYSVAVLMSGRIDIADFLRLLASYVDASFTLWSIVGLLWLLVLLYRRRPRNGRGDSPIKVIAAEVARRWESD